MGKKPIVSVTYENERISKRDSLPYMKRVLHLSCVVHGPIYGRFMGCTVNGLPWTTQERCNTRFTVKISCFFIELIV